MATEICDIQILPALVVTEESAAGAADGSIVVVASGDYGSTKEYAIGSDFAYPGGGNTTGIFLGLPAGTYTIYARSGSDCLATTEVVVPLASSYAVRFTNRYYDVGSNNRFKVDIEKRGYTGDPVEVNCRANVTWGEQGAEDPFIHIVPSSCSVELLSQTDEQFLELYTDDEREFIVKVYVYDGADWDLYWQGYIITGNYTAPYSEERNYHVTVSAADMLQNLSEISFGNSAGAFPVGRMTLMQGILMCLQHTDINLDVYEGVQILIPGVSEAYDETSMVELAYFDPAVHEGKTCFQVLDALLTVLQARVYQALGRWNIETITQKAGGTFNVRTRDFYGTETGAGFLETEPRLLLRKSSSPNPRVCYHDMSQVMKIAETFGTVEIINNFGLKEDNNILKNAHFVDVDIEAGQLDGWLVSTENPTPTIAAVMSPNGQTIEPLQAQFNAATTNEQLQVLSNAVPLAAFDGAYRLAISFDVYVSPVLQGNYLYFDLSLSISGGSPDDYFVGIVFSDSNGANALITDTAAGTYLIDGQFLRFFAEEPGWKTISLFTIVDSDVFGSVTGDFQALLRVSGNHYVDHVDVASLRAEATDGVIPTQTYNNRRRVLDTTGVNVIVYSLRRGTDPDDPPNIIRPNDYNGSLPYVWEFTSIQAYDPGISQLMGTFMVDNFVVQYLPDQVAPEESETIPAIINEKTKHNKEVEFLHGDPLDENYKNVTLGWLSLEDESTIDEYSIRLGASSVIHDRIVDLASTAYRGQFNARRWKESGTFSTMGLVPSFYNSFWELRNGKVFLPTYMSVDTKAASTAVELIETLSGAGIEDVGQIIDPTSPVVPIEPPPPEAGRVHSDDFSIDFS